MLNKAIRFNANELEIAVITYNRCKFIADWLKYCYEEIKLRNIKLSIYDSSTNEDTETYIENFKYVMKDHSIQYKRVDSQIEIGYKPIIALLNSTSKYTWIMADARYFDFSLLDKKVFPYIKQDIDYIILHAINNEENDGKYYIDKNELLKDCFISMTCIGLSIYKTKLFNPLKFDNQFKEKCMLKYRKNYAFAWIGFWGEVYALDNYKAVFSVIPVKGIMEDKKIRSWFKRFYGCWCEDLCDLMDGLSDTYTVTESVIKDTWKYMQPDSPYYCYQARKEGDLTWELYQKYEKKGLWKRVTEKADRIKNFALHDIDGLDKCQEEAIKEEEELFMRLCEKNIDNLKNMAKNKSIWIYGAGKGGQLLNKVFNQHNLKISGFIDTDAKKIKYCDGLVVKNIQEINADNCFVVISLFCYSAVVVLTLLKHGFNRDDFFFLCVN